MRNRVVVAAIAVALLVAPSRLLAQQSLPDGIKTLAEEVISGSQQQQKHRVAVMAFREIDGPPTVLGAYLAEALGTQLFRDKNIEVVERSLLDRVVAEMRLDATGAVDPATAAKIGKLAGVDAIVTGTITDLQSTVAINCRLIDVATARVFGASEVRIVKDDDIRAIMAAPIGVSAPRADSVAGGARASALDSRSDRSVVSQKSTSVQGFLFEFDSCARRGGEVACGFWVTNERQDRNFFVGNGVGTPGFSAIDDQGNSYTGSAIQVANKRMTPLGVTLASNVRTRLRFFIDGRVAGTTLARLQFSASASDVGFFKVTISDLTVTDR